MNKVILMGRLTREPDVRYSQNSDGSMAVARYTLAVDRRRARTNSDGAEQTADFISCVAFGRQGRICDGVFDRVFDLERASFSRNIEALFGEYDFRLCIRKGLFHFERRRRLDIRVRNFDDCFSLFRCFVFGYVE